MHDRNGTPLKIGDIVNVPCVIQNVCGSGGILQSRSGDGFRPPPG